MRLYKSKIDNKTFPNYETKKVLFEGVYAEYKNDKNLSMT